MARFSVPDRHRAALRAVTRLDPSEFDALLRLFEDLPLPRSREELVGAITASVPGLSREQADHLASAVIAAEASRIRYSFTSEEMAESIADSINDGVDKEQLVHRLAAVLSSDALRRIGKAVDVMLEHQQIFDKARIVTDIRPVFKDDAAEAPDGAVIVHTLKIDYHDNHGAIRSIFFGMDSRDVRSLREVADRATQKSESIQTALSDLPLALVDVTDEIDHDGGER